MLNLNLLDHSQTTEFDSVQIEETATQDIAIIGYAGKLPRSEGVEEFWQHLCHGTDFVTSFPESRKEDVRAYMDKLRLAEPEVTFFDGAYLDNIDQFDYQFFRLSPKEASLISPIQRLFLETAWKALEHAGYSSSKLQGTRTGVYVGHNADAIHDYKRMIEALQPEALSMAAPGNLSSMMAGRIAYLLDLKGPSLCIDTACSSSLVAVHMACQALRRGECDMILAGSVKINLLPLDQGIRIGIESSDCRAKTFDDAADGTGIGDGAIAFLLKPLDKALLDRDTIHAVIKGSAVNQDGSSAGITAPNVLAQEDVIVRAWQDAHIDPETISYVEVHGTGTELGDPIEIEGLTRAFRRYTDHNQFCAVSSLKSNIGHLDHAAGIAGLLKTVLSLKHQQLPPTVHFKKPNQSIDFLHSPVYVNNELSPWEANGERRRCGISAFGMSGTNCHIVVEEAPPVPEREDREQVALPNRQIEIESEQATITSEAGHGKTKYLFTLSAKSEQALQRYLRSYQEFVASDTAWRLADLCYTANTGREHYTYRLIMMVASKEEFISTLLKLRLKELKQLELSHVYYSHAETMHRIARPANDKLHALCQSYIQGQAIDWQSFFQGEVLWRIPLPTYPFEQSRCWIETEEASVGGEEERYRVALLSEKRATFSPTEHTVAEVWGEILGYRQLKLDTHYYELGGDSIIALKIVNRLNKAQGSSLEIADVLRYPTIEQLAHYMDTQRQGGEGKSPSAFTPIPIAEQRESYPLSSAQRRLYILHQVDPDNTSYHLPELLHLQGAVDIGRLEQVLQQLIHRHEVLRTSFELAEGEIVQRIHQQVEFRLEVIEGSKQEMEHVMRGFVQPFDLTKPPLLRAKLLVVNKEEYLLMLDIHHIVFDGTSMGIILAELMALYAGKELPTLELQYKDYASWQNQRVKQGELMSQKEYWLEQLAGELPVLQLPTDYPRPVLRSVEGSTFEVFIDAHLTERLKRLATGQQTTLFIVLLSTYYTLLAKYAGQEDIIVGTPVSGRGHQALEAMVGMFVNTMALRNYPQFAKPFQQFLQEVKENTIEAYKHQDFPFEELVTLLDSRDTGRNPLFDTMFVMQNMEIPKLTLGDVECVHERFDQQTAKFDLFIQAQETDQGLRFVVEYCTALFTEQSMKAMMQHYVQLLICVTDHPEQTIAQLDMLTKEEKQKLLLECNDTTLAYDKTKTIPQLVDEQAERTPNSIAIVCGEEALTYAELQERTNRLAGVLQQHGVGQDQLVALMVEPSVDMLVGMLGVLKAGGAYLPIDKNYPEARIQYMLEDSNSRLLLTQRHLHTPSFDGTILHLDEQSIYTGESMPSDMATHANHLAYVIYTSGSTGKPKGVAIEHQSVHNFICGMRQLLPLEQGRTILALTTISFDIFVLETLVPLTQGMKVIIAQEAQQLDPVQISRLIEEQAVDMLQVTPSRLQLLVQHAGSMEWLQQLQVLMVGGEPMPEVLINQVKHLTEAAIYNMYGPTEATVWSTVQEISSSNRITIGKPIANTQVYVLNEYNQLLPIGVTGELCISGDGLARGYLNQSELTNEKFVEHPFQAGKRLYRTGDMARWLPDGTIDFLGRRDHQVKVRGYRIETGEIEAHIASYEGVQESVVLAQQGEQAHTELIAYYVTDRELQASEIREYLLAKLPFYMIPAYFIPLEKLPLTPNGKVDRKALPQPTGQVIQRVAYVAPTNEVERTIAEVWQEVLHIEQVGIRDHFFELGGDSIKALQILFQLQAKGISLQVRDLLQYSTIEEIAPHAQEKQQGSNHVMTEGYFTLSPLQQAIAQRITVGQQPEHTVHPSIALSHPEGIDENTLHAVLQQLVLHHDSFRIRLHWQGEQMTPCYVEPETVQELYTFRMVETDDQHVLEVLQEEAHYASTTLDIVAGSSLHVTLIRSSEGDHLLFTAHQLIMDAYSWAILCEDFVTGYTQLSQQLPLQLAPKSASVKSWTEELDKLATSSMIVKEQAYWRELEALNSSQLPYDVQSSVTTLPPLGDVVEMKLDQDKTALLMEEVHRPYHTVAQDILLTALGLTMTSWTQQQQILVSLEEQERHEYLPKASIARTVGMFAHQFPFLLEVEEGDLGSLIKSVKEQRFRVPNKGIGYSLASSTQYEEQQVEGLMERKPQISFRYLPPIAINTKHIDGEQQYGQHSQQDVKYGDWSLIQTTALHSHTGIPAGVALAWQISKSQAELLIQLSYSSELFQKETVQALLQSYYANLLALIEHCVTQEKEELTPSDYGEDEMTMEELDDLLGLIEGLSDDDA